MKILKSYNIQIWCGLKERYGKKIHSVKEVESVCQKYVDEIGQCFSVTPTRFIYTKGNENGVVVGLIAYPRFPKPRKILLAQATELGTCLMKALNQYRVTITTPEKSYMLENNIK